ncbi:MFS transporter [soil metagenome]
MSLATTPSGAPAVPLAPVAPGVSASNSWRGGWRQGVAYGGLGLPLAFVALPLYVILPNHYASELGVPLAALGGVLLGARLLDAITDPLIGRWADRLFARSDRRAWQVGAIAAVVLAIGFAALFFPAVQGTSNLLIWCAALLAVTYLGYSVISVIHQAWGARLGGDEAQRANIVAWREGLALAGVLMASVLPSVAGLGVTTLVFAVALGAGIGLLWRAPRQSAVDGSTAVSRVPAPATTPSVRTPLADPAFRRLLAIYLVNGIASAVPATLVLFFIRDRLQAPSYEPLFLAAYFAAAGLAIPLWVRVVARFGLARTWLIAMVLAIAVFLWATFLGAGDVAAFALVCALSGVALGADLTLPSALLTGVIQRAGHGGRAEGAYVGWWSFATKLNLALAAGVSLPALQAFGYAPGSRSEPALTALTLAYCVLPCVLKLVAAALLYGLWLRSPDTSQGSA